MSDQLPRLIDCRGIQQELGVKRAMAERVMRHCPRIVRIGRKVFVHRSDALKALEQLTEETTAA